MPLIVQRANGVSDWLVNQRQDSSQQLPTEAYALETFPWQNLSIDTDASCFINLIEQKLVIVFSSCDYDHG